MEDIIELNRELKREIILAKADYLRKKREKKEIVNYIKMRKAINKRKKIKNLCYKLHNLQKDKVNSLLEDTA